MQFKIDEHTVYYSASLGILLKQGKVLVARLKCFTSYVA